MLLRRSHDISRLEAFSDAVFAFALTLLVVALEVPKSYDELMKLMGGFLSFASCFSVLLLIWYEHNLSFRRYGLSDPAHWAYQSWADRKRKRFEAKLTSQPIPAPVSQS